MAELYSIHLSRHLPVLQYTGFHRSAVISKSSVLYQELEKAAIAMHCNLKVARRLNPQLFIISVDNCRC